VLIVGSIFILTETIPRLLSPEEVNAKGMIWIAILGVVVDGAAVLKLRKSHPIINPLLSMCIACFILYNVVKNMRETMNIMRQKIPKQINRVAVEKWLDSYPWVLNHHDLHIWTMDGEYNILTVHLVIKDNCTINQLRDFKALIQKD